MIDIVKAKESQKSDFPEGIPECGADALRFGLLAYTLQGRDINLDIKRVVGYRQFCNKVWNALRFALTYLSDFVPGDYLAQSKVHLHPSISKRDLYILSRLHDTTVSCDTYMKEYSFGALTSSLHSFFLYEVCDLYLELIKPVFNDSSEENRGRKEAAQATLYTVIEQFLRLCHPIMPFVTEELWQRLPNKSSLTSIRSIMIAPYPEPISEWCAPHIIAEVELVNKAVHGARSLRADYKIPNHIKANFFYRSEAGVSSPFEDSSLCMDFCTLSKASSFSSLSLDLPIPKGHCVRVLDDQYSLVVNLSGIIDANVEIARLQKEVERLNPFIDSYTRKMNAPDYETKVPEQVRNVNSEKLAGYQGELKATLEALTLFESMK